MAARSFAKKTPAKTPPWLARRTQIRMSRLRFPRFVP